MSSELLWSRVQPIPPSSPIFLKYFLNAHFVPGTVLGSAGVNRADQILPLQSSHSSEENRQQ